MSYSPVSGAEQANTWGTAVEKRSFEAKDIEVVFMSKVSVSWTSLPCFVLYDHFYLRFRMWEIQKL
jgi:hypothetical protein